MPDDPNVRISPRAVFSVLADRILLEGQKWGMYQTRKKNDLWEAKRHYVMPAPSQLPGSHSKELGWLDWLLNLGSQNEDSDAVVLPSLHFQGKKGVLVCSSKEELQP